MPLCAINIVLIYIGEVFTSTLLNMCFHFSWSTFLLAFYNNIRNFM